MVGIALGGGPFGVVADCCCHRCIREKNIKSGAPEDTLISDWPLSSVAMIVCGHCGNKRCPHASDHNLECTNSNKLGQRGSIYTSW